MNAKASRHKLEPEEISRCHALIDELVDLHRQTDPSKGQQTEKDKKEKALQALNKIGLIGGILTEWAEDQLFGAYYQVAKSNTKRISQEVSDQHENELMWHTGELPSDFFESDDDIACERAAMAEILKNTFGRYGRMGWRMSLSESLYALNEGQIDTLLEPVNARQQGKAFDIQQIKFAAIKHVYKLSGEGWKKEAAISKLADACGVSYKAIEKWEAQALAERTDKSALEWLTKAAMFVCTEKKRDSRITDIQTVSELSENYGRKSILFDP